VNKAMFTAEQVEKSMIDNNIESVDHHNCSLCGYMTKYIRQGESLYFDAGCDCTGGETLYQRDFEDAADWINMQSNAEVKEQLAKKFGLIQ
jgi:hypothetical protein